MKDDGISEGEYLSQLHEGAEVEATRTVAQMKEDYTKAKQAKVGTSIQCPTCGTNLVKKSYQHAFCGEGCKDRYWNMVDEKRNFRRMMWA